jgi:hypothetical protein
MAVGTGETLESLSTAVFPSQKKIGFEPLSDYRDEHQGWWMIAQHDPGVGHPIYFDDRPVR